MPDSPIPTIPKKIYYCRFHHKTLDEHSVGYCISIGSLNKMFFQEKCNDKRETPICKHLYEAENLKSREEEKLNPTTHETLISRKNYRKLINENNELKVKIMNQRQSITGLMNKIEELKKPKTE